MNSYYVSNDLITVILLLIEYFYTNITAHTTSVEKLLELAHSLLHSYIIRKPFLLPRVDMGSYDFALGSSRLSFLLQRQMTFLISGNAVSPCP